LIISSFDHEALRNVQAINANIPLGILFYYRMLEPWKYVASSGLQIASVHPLYTTISEEFIERFHEMDIKIYPFTVNKEKHYDKLIAKGVDGVFSNNPNIFKTK